jgi:RNA polymerase sigma-70 factor (ECF subfamily)
MHCSPATIILDPDRLRDHLPRLRRLAAYLTGSRDHGEDLLQDTLERVLRSPRQVQGDAYPYLTRALRNTHVDRARAAARRPQTVELIPEAVEAPSAVDDRAEAVLEAREVLAAVAALPEVYRSVVVAVDVQGCSYSEAAERLGVPVGTIMSRLYRGRRRVVAAVEGSAEAPAALLAA